MRFFYFSTLLSVATGTLLRPIKSRSLHTRDLLNDLSPVSDAEISYAGHDGYTSHIRLHAHPERPLIIQERFQDLLTGTICTAGGESLAFEFQRVEDANQAYKFWSAHGRAIAVVDDIKSGCRGYEERGAYLIRGITLDSPGHRVILQTKSIPLRAAATKLSVSLYPPSSELRKRQDVDDPNDGIRANDTFSLAVGKPGDRIEVPLPNLPTGEAKVHCIGCRTSGNVMITAHFDVDTDADEVIEETAEDVVDFFKGKKNDNTAPELGTDEEFDLLEVDQAYLAVEVIQDLKATAVMEFFAKGKLSFEPLRKSVLPVPLVLPVFSIGGVLTIGPQLDVQVLVGLDVDTPGVNFTYGSELVVPKGAIARLDYASGGNASKATGWDKSEFNDIPFHLNSLDGEFSFTASITAQPNLEIGIFLVGGKFGGAGVGIAVDLPKVTAKGSYVHNVNSNCLALGISDTVYHPSALNVTTGVGIALNALAKADLKLGKNTPRIMREFSQAWEKQLWGKDFNVAQTCWAFDTATLGETKPATAADAVPIPQDLKAQVDAEAIARGEDPAAPGAGSVNVPMRWWIAISVPAVLMAAFG